MVLDLVTYLCMMAILGGFVLSGDEGVFHWAHIVFTLYIIVSAPFCSQTWNLIWRASVGRRFLGNVRVRYCLMLNNTPCICRFRTLTWVHTRPPSCAEKPGLHRVAVKHDYS